MSNERREKRMKKNKLITAAICIAMFSQLSVFAEEPALNAGDSLKIGDYTESAQETQALIDSRPNIQRRLENMNRGLVAVNMDSYVFISWRWLGTESSQTLYNLYKDGELMNSSPLNATNYTDINPTDGAKYQVAPVVDGVEGEKCDAVTAWENAYKDVKISKPNDNEVNGEKYSYSAGDASVADLDGDGEYEIILKWDPSNAKDAAQTGFTGECIIDAYKQDGTLMWRINMGPNIRAGAHDTQFMVYDFDGDGKAEMVCRTADGTIAGDGTVIGDKDKNWAVLNDGKNLQGPLYLTAFNGEDGSVIDTIDYDPQTTGDGYDQTDWGDGYGNRSERYLAGIGTLDGETTSFIFCRGYYTGSEGPLGGRTVIAAYNLEDGKIVKKWVYDTKEHNNENIGQGNHSMSLADVDYDGCDEIIYGSLTVDHDGTPMYSTGLGHGDAQHVADIDPDRPGLEVFSCHEDTKAEYSYDLRDARTGEILFAEKQRGFDNGRAATGDIDPNYAGDECWSAAGVLTDAKGNVISTDYTMSANFLNWWDGDLGREVQDGIYISKWNHDTMKTDTIFTASGAYAVNGTKANPSITADIIGDWREETIYPLNDMSALRIYTTTIPTGYRIPTLMSDGQYRNHVALQNTCYNQPTHLSYYLGYDTETIPVPQMYVMQDGEKVTNPDLDKKTWNIEDLYTGESIKLVTDCPTALIEGAPVRVDNDNTDIVPYVSDEGRTLVPIRFISESLGADVEWEEEQQLITITKGSDVIKMNIGNTTYSVNDKENTLETAPIITNDRTMVPLRAISEAFGQKVYWNDGLIVISDIDCTYTDEEAAAQKNEILSAPVPAKTEQIALNAVGEKYYDNQLDVFAVEATGNDGNLEQGAVDLDMSTRWSNYGPSELILDLGSVKTVSGVSIACWKGNERIYPFTIEYSEDGKTWNKALEKSQNTGESDEFEQFMFDTSVKARYIKYKGDGATDPEKNYCHISEIAILGE